MESIVIFIDDQEDFLELLKIRLEEEPYKKIFLTDGNLLNEYLRKYPIDVVVSDINMPKSGIEIFKYLKKEYPSITRIALSSLTHPRELLKAINEGEIHKYIPKPWKVDEEGKQIIRDAILYTYFQKSHCTYGLTEADEVNKINNILKNLNINYMISKKKIENSIPLNEIYYLIPRM
ncbi:Response regulator receiver domain-containing protein [Cetobacterium ceti]|uniref:Response regulator receiver domain-containing protein n=1 Tax=Cetobacterium ceti TaxID=180163 RepID=A0A1T4MPD4_9FUSO|nr:response regulator [Cetobacterium ceti]SJZ68872.1 Response regulator receiver domain-containing protein [Cetobacterium ceti]